MINVGLTKNIKVFQKYLVANLKSQFENKTETNYKHFQRFDLDSWKNEPNFQNAFNRNC